MLQFESIDAVELATLAQKFNLDKRTSKRELGVSIISVASCLPKRAEGKE